MSDFTKEEIEILKTLINRYKVENLQSFSCYDLSKTDKFLKKLDDFSNPNR